MGEEIPVENHWRNVSSVQFDFSVWDVPYISVRSRVPKKTFHYIRLVSPFKKVDQTIDSELKSGPPFLLRHKLIVFFPTSSRNLCI